MRIPPGIVAAWERLKRRETKEDRRLVTALAWSPVLAALVVVAHFLF